MSFESGSSDPSIPGIKGTNTVAGSGVLGDSTLSDAVVGFAHATGKAGVLGLSPNGNAVAGISDNGTGVFGQGGKFGGAFTGKTEGVHATSDGNAVHGESTASDAVVGFASAATTGKAGVLGLSPNGNAVAGISDNGTGIFGQGGKLAGSFVGKVLVHGDVEVTGDIRLVNADLAEDFCIAGSDELELGTVMVLDAEGALRQSEGAYDKHVAGVLSGAGSYKPGIILDKQESQDRRLPVALVGKVYCKVDAQHAPVQVGDLLTTSPTPGHAMKAADPLKAFGSVIGKALRPLESGQGLVPILIALQ